MGLGILLLVVLTATCPRLSGAEGDPLPPSLLDLVWTSPISSINDLKHLLEQQGDSIEEEDEPDVLTNYTHGRYTRSLVEAQPAQQAVCKVRTEVMEVTRAMVDRRSTNFLVWPPCVEVQRCSGCCNTGMLQCVPTVTSTRYLQVSKILFVNRKVFQENAVISVEDHVSCRCQAPSSSSSVPLPRSSAHASPLPPPPPPQQQQQQQQQQQPPPSRPLPLPGAAPQKPPASKAELHRHDELKHNQEREPVTRHWQQGRYTQLAHWSHQPRTHQLPVHTALGGWPADARAEQGGRGSGSERVREEPHQQPHHHHHHHQRQQHHLYPLPAHSQDMSSQYRLHAPQSDSASPPGNSTTQPTNRASEESHAFPAAPTKDSAMRVTKDGANTEGEVTGREQTETEAAGHKKGNVPEESGPANSGEASTEQVNQKPDKDSELTGTSQLSLTEERNEKRLDIVRSEPYQPIHPQHPHPHPHSSDHHHPQHRPKPTTFETVVSTVAPGTSSTSRTPLRSALLRRRRKHRNRISKATMRARIM